MSKKDKKDKKNKSRISSKIKHTQSSKRMLNLESVLQSIYHDFVNLETTCNHRCECCNVAMPQMNYSEFVQIVTVLWNKLSKDEKIGIICQSIEYFLRNEYKKWGRDSLIKPCMLLDSNRLCKCYKDRSLNCRLYGLWPQDEYNRRVDKFEQAYSQFDLKREDLPLYSQCQNVKRIDETIPLTIELINELFHKLDDLDKDIGGFSNLRITQKENYRAFHDWLLLKIYGEKWLILLTTFMLATTREQMEDQVNQLKKAVGEAFSKDDLPDITKVI